MSEVIIKPILTEKSSLMSESGNRFVFMVDRRADKPAIRAEVEKTYNVTVVSVNTINVAGKKKSRHTKRGFTQGKTNHYKKAIVTVAEGQRIDVYENI